MNGAKSVKSWVIEVRVWHGREIVRAVKRWVKPSIFTFWWVIYGSTGGQKRFFRKLLAQKLRLWWCLCDCVQVAWLCWCCFSLFCWCVRGNSKLLDCTHTWKLVWQTNAYLFLCFLVCFVYDFSSSAKQEKKNDIAAVGLFGFEWNFRFWR